SSASSRSSASPLRKPLPVDFRLVQVKDGVNGIWQTLGLSPELLYFSDNRVVLAAASGDKGAVRAEGNARRAPIEGRHNLARTIGRRWPQAYRAIVAGRRQVPPIGAPGEA